MLFRRDILQGIAENRVTLAFRRWRRAPPAEGSSLRSPVGVIRLDRVTVVEEGDITAEDMRRTGMSRDELRASIAGDGTLVRIELCLAGDDPRIALREREPDHAELEAIVVRLARIDAACPTRWTTRYLQLVADQPGIVSRALAPQADADVPAFKRRVRQLKELGLTESLEVGYRLSPRGRAVSSASSAIRAENADSSADARRRCVYIELPVSSSDFMSLRIQAAPLPSRIGTKARQGSNLDVDPRGLRLDRPRFTVCDLEQRRDRRSRRAPRGRH